MIIATFFAILLSVFWSIFADTDFYWISYLCSVLVGVCMFIAYEKYEKLERRISEIEKKIHGGHKK